MPKRTKTRSELPVDLADNLTTNDSFEARIEALLVAILRELKRLK